MIRQINHFDNAGNAIMVDVSDKDNTKRIAIAKGTIKMNNLAFDAVQSGASTKGYVLAVARVAGIMSTKRTSDLIPMCHPLLIEKVSVDFILKPEEKCVDATCTVQTTGKTGVEMEALCGVTTALLTIYDMCKAIDRSMEICCVSLLEKQGGASGFYKAEDKK